MTLIIAPVIAVLFCAMALVPVAAEARIAYSHVGQFGGPTTEAQPGLFHAAPMPQRMAVHEESGKLFVADRGNHRIQVFSPTATAANFEFAVPVPAPVGVAIDQATGDLYVTHPAVAARNELQVIQLASASSGTYTLTFEGETTAPIAFNATAPTVQAALRAIPSINGANVNVTGSVGNDTLRNRFVTFVGTLAGTDVSEITADTSELNAEAQATVTTAIAGGPPEPAQIRKLNPDVAADPAAYSPDLTFTSPAVGAGQQIGGLQSGSNDLANGGGIAVDPTTGEILIADTGKNLVQRFDSDGAHQDDFDGATGGRPVFAGIRDLAVTSTGDIIVADVAAGQGRIDRFDGEGELQATLSQNNNPVPNPGIGSAGNNWAIVLAVNAADEVLASSVTSGGAFSRMPSRVYQFEVDQHVADFTAPANFVGPIYGTAAGSSPGRLYAMGVEWGVFASPSSPRVQVFDAAVPPTAAIDPVTDYGATEAALSGTVNPQGNSTMWRFEYRPVGGSSWTAAPDPDGGPLEGSEHITVTTVAQGLQPNTEYEVRLVATGDGNVETVSSLPNPTFTTEREEPRVDSGVSFITTSGAKLTGGVNPRNSETSYQFEYGLDQDYGQMVPADLQSVGSGNTRITVAATIGGLEPGITYHFRLVAENEIGQVSHTEDATFTTLETAAPGLGPDRGWELITRLPTGGVLPDGGGYSSLDGDSYLYMSHHTHAHYPWLDTTHNKFLATREEHGWDSTPIDTPLPYGWGQLAVPSVDMSRILMQDVVSHHPDDQNSEAGDLYLREPNGDLSWVTRGHIAPPGEPQLDAVPVLATGWPRASSMSEDGATVAFASNRRLLEEDPHPSQSNTRRLYKWSGGELQLISKLADDTVLHTVALGSNLNSPNAVSRDGSRVFWSHGQQVYAHVEGMDTIEVGTGRYASATPDGSRVFTYGGGRLQSFEVDSETPNDLTGVAGVLGVAAVAEDGNRVYFVATGVLDASSSPFGDRPIDGANNLYVVELSSEGAPIGTRFVTRLGGGGSGQDGPVWAQEFDVRAAAISSDGSVLTFGSVEELAEKPTGGFRQAYVYDLSTHSLVCASCPADVSSLKGGHANTRVDVAGNDVTVVTSGWSNALGYLRLVTEDGTVFLSTREALVPEDENDARDVYEYRNGDLRLVSRGGPSDAAVEFSGASRDGRTAFITTPAALVPQDNEPDIQKVYAARTGGGFPAPLLETPACEGEGCQELRGSSAPEPPLIGSSSSRGNDKPAVRQRVRARMRIALAKRRRGSMQVLRVRVSDAGRVLVSGPAIRRVVRRAPKAGVYRLPVRLKTATARRLHGKNVRIRVRVTYRSVTGSATARSIPLKVGRRLPGPNRGGRG